MRAAKCVKSLLGALFCKSRMSFGRERGGKKMMNLNQRGRKCGSRIITIFMDQLALSETTQIEHLQITKTRNDL